LIADLHTERKKTQAKAINQQSYLLALTNINLISTETCAEPVLDNTTAEAAEQHAQNKHSARLQVLAQAPAQKSPLV
jgi:hypothetical protein